jgi:signal-transduction protein with cAMP-binding, CBS, and nucleotidyltransferase domain
MSCGTPLSDSIPDDGMTAEERLEHQRWQKLIVARYRKKQRELRKAERARLDIFDLRQGVQELRAADGEKESSVFMDVFDRLFKEKLENYL